MDELTAKCQKALDYDNYHDDRFYRPYVKEVFNVYKQGNLTIRQIQAIYNEILLNFDPLIEASDTRRSIYNLRKNERNYYHSIIDEVCHQYDPTLDWRIVKFNPNRIKRCNICQSYYYDFSRNGKSLTCDNKGAYRRYDLTNKKYYYYHKNGKKLSECAVEYEKRRRAAPEGWTEEDIIYPHSRRRVEEVAVDMQTDHRY